MPDSSESQNGGRVLTIYDPLRDRVNVYVRAWSEGQWATQDGFETVAAGAEPPIFVSLPSWVADDLKQALEGRREPATNRHLDDAIEVRDRLLALVEAKWKERRS